MLEDVDTIVKLGKTYCWAQYIADMIKGICEKCQETIVAIKLPSLIIWIPMYYLCPIGDRQFLELTRFHMWHFKPFSMDGNSQELEGAKVLLENWFQNLKVLTSRWRVPQNIRRCIPLTTHIQLELDHIVVWYMKGVAVKDKHLDCYPTDEEIFKELSLQSNTKISIPAAAKKRNQPILEPLTDQEKEEYYEVHLHINTSTSKETPIEEKNTFHIVTISQPQQALVLTKQ